MNTIGTQMMTMTPSINHAQIDRRVRDTGLPSRRRRSEGPAIAPW